MRKFILLLLLLCTTFFCFCQVRWASEVLDFSSQYTTSKYAVEQVLGEPNVFPKGGESALAWSPKTMDSKYEFIKVGFGKSFAAKQITVYENFGPGAITAIYTYNSSGEKTLIRKFKATSGLRTKRVLDVQIPSSVADVVAVKIELNCKKVEGYNQIDAIALSEKIGEIDVVVNVAKDIIYDGDAERLSEAVNTSKYAEQNPVIAPDGKTLFFNRIRHPLNSGGIDDENEIWVSKKNRNGDWGTAYNIGGPLNNKSNNFVCSTSPNGNNLLVGNAYNKDGTMGVGVSVSFKYGGKWEYPLIQEIEAYYNNSEYVEFCRSASGKYLIAAIERNDTKGERDLYVSFFKGNNNWAEPINLGSIINTAASDFVPFLASDDKTLYFSSYGHPGFGKADIFVSKRLDDTWTNWSKPKNLGTKINGKGWDAGYTVSAKGDYAYFNSDKGRGTDIYKIKLPQELRPDPVVLIKGKVLNRKNNEPVLATVAYENLKTGKEAGRVVSDIKTGEYTIILPYGYNYGFRADAENFISINNHLNLSKVKEYKEIENNLSLVPIQIGEVVRLNNIFFEFGKSVLQKESFPELERIITLLNKNTTLKIEIGGHTDNIGDDKANELLAENRAISVVEYLVSKGIRKESLKAFGYGESIPISSNETEEGKELNRRVEFKILTK